jgi:hypothetical protein
MSGQLCFDYDRPSAVIVLRHADFDAERLGWSSPALFPSDGDFEEAVF